MTLDGCGRVLSALVCGMLGGACSAESDGSVAQPQRESIGQGRAALSAATSRRHGKELPPIAIPMRSFSPNPSVGGSATSVSDVENPNYGALSIFIEKAAAYTGGSVAFSVVSWNPTAPNTVIEQVGLDGDDRDAAYDTGGALNPAWGLFFLSMAPFHLSYRQTLDWLYEAGGLELAQSLVDARQLNVKIIPVLSSNPQVAGHFKAPIGAAEHHGAAVDGIGMAGLCTAGWTLRFLPPGQNIIDRACDDMVADGSIAAKNLSFVNAIPGLSNLAAIQSGAVTGFEQATPMDDLSLFYPEPGPAPVPQSLQNPGHKGLRFLHFPAWHQPFLLGFVLLNETAIWDELSRSEQHAVERAGRDALSESFEVSESVQCGRLRELLAFNDGQPQLDALGNPIVDASGVALSADLQLAKYDRASLQRLEDATAAYLEVLRGGDSPTLEQLEFRQVHDSVLAYERSIQFRWRPPTFPGRCDDL
jgi:TRAP-type mannitol/chloroaromatic compound transport system substrate-binding protein